MWKMEGTNGSKLMNRAGMFDSNATWILIPLHQEIAKGNVIPIYLLSQTLINNHGAH